MTTDTKDDGGPARMPEKVIRDGKVAVLISPGFGAGWSTWNSGHEPLFLFDRRFVEASEAGADVSTVEAIGKELTGDEYVCVLGWPVRIEWLPVGTPFNVEEYDGSESLRTADDLYHVA